MEKGSLRIRGKVKGTLAVKDCDLPGIEFQLNCSLCGNPSPWTEWELTYPRIGEWIRCPVRCFHCDLEWHEMVRISMTIEVKK